MIVVSDTSPLNYLILIGAVEVLPRLFDIVVVPDGVRAEMTSAGAPSSVQAWIATPPDWLQVRHAGPAVRSAGLQRGEEEAISLALALSADALLVDDAAARAAATELGLHVVGTLGVLRAAADRGLLDLADAVRKLQSTSFRVSARLLAQLGLDPDTPT